MVSCEYLVIGGGKTGLRLVKELNKLNKQVILLEHDTIGGNAMNYTTLPRTIYTKETEILRDMVMYFSSHNTISKKLYNLRKTIPTRVENKLNLQHSYVENQLEHLKNITLIHGFANFDNPHTCTVKVGSKQHRIKFKKAFICTGKPKTVIEGVVGLAKDHTLTLYSLYRLEHIPNSMVFIGLNETTISAALVYSYLGVKVTIVEKVNVVFALPQVDQSVLSYIIDVLDRQGVSMLFHTNISHCTYLDGEYTLFNNKIPVTKAEYVYVPNHEEYDDEIMLSKLTDNFSSTGIKTNNGCQLLKHSHIYALGRCNDGGKSEQLLANIFESEMRLKKEKYLSMPNKIAMYSLRSFKQATSQKKKPQFEFVIRTLIICYSFGSSQKLLEEKIGKYAKVITLTDPEKSGFIKLIYDEKSQQLKGFAGCGEIIEIFQSYLVFALDNSHHISDITNHMQKILFHEG